MEDYTKQMDNLILKETKKNTPTHEILQKLLNKAATISISKGKKNEPEKKKRKNKN
jgi:hypothetical protein